MLNWEVYAVKNLQARRPDFTGIGVSTFAI
jgi:hypothetical protein